MAVVDYLARVRPQTREMLEIARVGRTPWNELAEMFGVGVKAVSMAIRRCEKRTGEDFNRIDRRGRPRKS